jgi:hypothetical protein
VSPAGVPPASTRRTDGLEEAFASLMARRHPATPPIVQD